MQSPLRRSPVAANAYRFTHSCPTVQQDTQRHTAGVPRSRPRSRSKLSRIIAERFFSASSCSRRHFASLCAASVSAFGLCSACSIMNRQDFLVSNKTERITRRHTLREVRHFRVNGQPARSRVRWHVHKSSLPEEENKGDTSENRTRDHSVTSRARYHCAIPAAQKSQRNFSHWVSV